MKINVVRKVDIEVTQSDLEQMIREKIAEQDSEITVSSIEFIPRRDPNKKIDVVIKAHHGPADETEYLNSTDANKERLEESIAQAEEADPEAEPEDTTSLFN